MEKLIKRLKLIGKECINFLSNIICPIISLLLVILETVGVPKKILDQIKKVEYICFYACGTQQDI